MASTNDEDYEKGYKKYFDQAFHEAFKEGQKLKSEEIASRLLPLYSFEKISEFTELTIDEVKKIAEKVKFQE